MKLRDSLGYLGPSRRSDRTVIEQVLELESGDLAGLPERGPGMAERLSRLLQPAGAGGLRFDLPALQSGRDPALVLATLYADAAIALQRAAGHPVAERGVLPVGQSNRVGTWFEHEHFETGRAAGELALALIGAATGDASDLSEDPAWSERVAGFVASARAHAMPTDTQAIVRAARRRGIPVFRMDREPFLPIRGSFRLRINGLLRLGHGRHQHTVDGTFCVDRCESLHPLTRDRHRLAETLARLELPGPDGMRRLRTPARAIRAARGLGFPLVVKPATRSHGRGVNADVGDEAALAEAAETALRHAPAILIEPRVAGRSHHVLMAGGEILAVLEAHHRDPATGRREVRPLRVEAVHDSVLAACRRIAGALPAGLLVVDVVAPDVRRPLESSGGRVVDVDLAPELDRLLPVDGALMAAAAEALVDWVCPPEAPTRIPVLTVTGTNGKTTTCRMLRSILTAAGHTVGLTTSTGVYVGERLLSETEESGPKGHHMVLDTPEVDAAVLEASRGPALGFGLGYERCDVSVCLNVSADHLGQFGIDTVEQMAGVKGWITSKSDDAVVLNADDDHCRAMAGQLRNRRIGLVSLTRAADTLLALPGTSLACALDRAGGRDRILLVTKGARFELMDVAEVPSAFGGAARHNLGNAMHAAAAAFLQGVDPAAIKAGLAAFEPSFKLNPGRLNYFRGLAFDVVMDFAHNPDGMARIREFTDQLEVPGRRIVALSTSAANSDEHVRRTAGILAGGYDHYVCKNYGLLYGREPHEMPQLLKEGLVREGVPPEDITMEEDEFDGIDAAMDRGREGDFVLILAGKRTRQLWEHITSYPQRRREQKAGDASTRRP